MPSHEPADIRESPLEFLTELFLFNDVIRSQWDNVLSRSVRRRAGRHYAAQCEIALHFLMRITTHKLNVVINVRSF